MFFTNITLKHFHRLFWSSKCVIPHMEWCNVMSYLIKKIYSFYLYAMHKDKLWVILIIQFCGMPLWVWHLLAILSTDASNLGIKQLSDDLVFGSKTLYAYWILLQRLSKTALKKRTVYQRDFQFIVVPFHYIIIQKTQIICLLYTTHNEWFAF